MRILYVGSMDSKSSFMDCIAGIDAKQRDKLSRKLALLKMGNSVISPDIKHFSISKYSRLYELQMKGQIRLRVIFTLTKAHGGDDILLVLVPLPLRCRPLPSVPRNFHMDLQDCKDANLHYCVG